MKIYPVTIIALVIAIFASPSLGRAATNSVTNTWNLTVSEGEAIFEQVFDIYQPLSSQVRGAAFLDSASVESVLRGMGARDSGCKFVDDGKKLSFSCTATYSLASAARFGNKTLSLPGDEILNVLKGIPAYTANSIDIRTHGTVLVDGTFIDLPRNISQKSGQMGQHVRTYGLVNFHRLSVEGNDVLAPGDYNLPFDTNQAPIAIYSDSYFPGGQAWLAFLAALVVLVLVTWRIFPNRLREVALQTIAPTGILSFWPKIFNTALGLVLAISGALLGVLAFLLYGVQDLQEFWKSWLIQIGRFFPAPLPYPEFIMTWFPPLLVVLSVLFVAIGIGLLARKQPARWAAASVTLVLLALVTGGWAYSLLLPPVLFMLQTIILFITGCGLVIFLAFVFRLITHPSMRRFYYMENRRS